MNILEQLCLIQILHIANSAQQVTGIFVNGSSMTVNGILVDDMDTDAAVIGYVKWIKASFLHALLMSQNDRRFDFPLIFKKVMNMELF